MFTARCISWNNEWDKSNWRCERWKHILIWWYLMVYCILQASPQMLSGWINYNQLSTMVCKSILPIPHGSYIYRYIYICECIYIYIYVCVRVYIYICECAYIYICEYIYIYVSIYIYKYIYVSIYIYMWVYIYVSIYICEYTYYNIYIYIPKAMDSISMNILSGLMVVSP